MIPPPAFASSQQPIFIGSDSSDIDSTSRSLGEPLNPDRPPPVLTAEEQELVTSLDRAAKYASRVTLEQKAEALSGGRYECLECTHVSGSRSVSMTG